MVDVVLLLPPPPHATAINRQPTAARIPKTRTLSPLLDLGDIDALRHHGRHIGTATEVAHVATLLEDERRRLYGNWTSRLALLRRYRFLHRLKVGTEQL